MWEEGGTADGLLTSRNVLEVPTKAISPRIIARIIRFDSLGEALLVMLLEKLLAPLHTQGRYAVIREFAPPLSRHEDFGDL